MQYAVNCNPFSLQPTAYISFLFMADLVDANDAVILSPPGMKT
jgi:hypothetical protein